MKTLIVFDLDDTLAKSKQPIGRRMGLQVSMLLQGGYKVSIISGCHYQQMQSQVLPHLQQDIPRHNLFLQPTSGAQLYTYDNTGWTRQYSNDLTLREKVFIYQAWESAIYGSRAHQVTDQWGEIAEDRGSQVTFSMLGQEAPITAKESYDPDMQIRGNIAYLMKEILGVRYDVRIGGSTSIDVSRVGLDKANGLKCLLGYLDIPKEEVLFVGDKLQPGGNDYSVKEAGYDCLEVSGPQETYNIIGELLLA